MEKRPILIIAAMEDTELNILKKINKIENKIQMETCTFYETSINNYPVVLCSSNIGCIQASNAITIAILKYNPIAIINEGLAGAHGKDIHKGDIVVGTEIININSIKTPKLKEGEGIDIFNWELVTFIKGQDDELKVEKADKLLTQCVKDIEKEYTKGKVIYGRIGSGDVWNNEADRIMYLNQKYNTLCEEMEGIAIYQIANQYNIPVIGIRVISNNEVLNEEYDVSTGEKVQYFVQKLVERYIENYVNL